MNSQERDLLTQLLKQLAEVKLTEKDAEAETLIREATAHQPDAAYLLVQRALLLEHALNTTKAQNADLQAQLHNNQSGQQGSLLANNPWAQVVGNTNPAPVASSRQTPQYSPQPGSSLFGGGSSFLGSVATTAAGVVAGSFLFNGIENLMGHHSSGFGQHALNDTNTEPTTVTNNYYGNDAEQQANKNDDNSNDFQASNNTDSFQDDAGDSDWT
jgi:uncharacterized protein